MIRISPDGNYVLAQDDSNAFILQRQPLKALVRFDASDAASAQFTPDSRSVILLFDAVGASPRVERWDIAAQKRTEIHEIYVRDGCLLAQVAPDGRTLACITLGDIDSESIRFNLDLYDVATGTSFLQKKGWTAFNLAGMAWLSDIQLLAEFESITKGTLEKLSPMAFSLDGRYFLVHTQQNTLVVDLVNRSPIETPANVKALLKYSFAFLPNDRLVGVAGDDGEMSEVVEFPGGKVVYKDLKTGFSRVASVTKGDFVILRPIKDHPLGVFDLKQNKIVLASKRSALDVWDDRYIAERLDGDVQVFELNTVKPIEHAQLPDAPLGKVRADAISSDLNWLAISQKTRGAVWNLQTGRRQYHLRGFSAAYFGSDSALYADFPKYLSTNRTLVRVALDSDDIRPQRTIDEKKQTIEVGHYLLTISQGNDSNVQTNVTFELSDVIDGKVVWTKHISHERPAYHIDVRANCLVFYWKTNAQAAKSIAKEDAAAASAIAAFKDKDSAIFAQVFDLDSGKQRAELAFDTGKHSIQVASITATGDRAIVNDGETRILVYSFGGQLKGTIAGHSPELAASADLLTVHTERGELELYDLSNVQKRATYDFSSRVAFNGFSGDGKRLLVLTADQVVYVLDATAKSPTDSVAQK